MLHTTHKAVSGGVLVETINVEANDKTKSSKRVKFIITNIYQTKINRYTY